MKQHGGGRAAWWFAAMLVLSGVANLPADALMGHRRLAELETESWRTAAQSVCATGAVPSIVFIALDGVRVDEVFEGVDPAFGAAHGLTASEFVGPEELMPHLHNILRTRGAALGAPGYGAEVRATGPAWCSLPGYQEMLTGHPAKSCLNNSCSVGRRPTLADEFATLPCSALGDVAVISSWETLDRAGASNPSAVVMSNGRTHGLTRGRFLADQASRNWLMAGERAGAYPGQDDYRPDRLTAGLAMAYLKSKHPRFMFLGLGDSDEFAHHNDYRAYLRSLREADQVVGEVEAELAIAERSGRRTALLITADHGRSKDFKGHGAGAPESGRVWLVAAGSMIERRGLAYSERGRYLADIAPTIRRMVGLAPDGTPGAGSVIDELLSPPIGRFAHQGMSEGRATAK